MQTSASRSWKPKGGRSARLASLEGGACIKYFRLILFLGVIFLKSFAFSSLSLSGFGAITSVVGESYKSEAMPNECSPFLLDN